MHLATKTLAAIAATMEKDQGSSYRGLLRVLMPMAEDAYREEDGGFRTHLGASLIGRECARELWYSFHWATKPKFDGRILRLFNRGHLEEPRMIALLMMIGCKVYQQDVNGKQFRISGHDGHYGGSLDGVVVGIPDLPPGTPCLTEYKTHNDKSFSKLISEGCINAKYEHFVQQQQYMGKYNLTHSLYMATNKNNDDLHAEIIEFDQVVYERFDDRAGMIVTSNEPPPKINNSPAFFKCKFCDQSPVCHEGFEPNRNCRTCRWSQPALEGEWVCCNNDMIVEAEMQGWEDPIVLNKESQEAGCEKYKTKSCFGK